MQWPATGGAFDGYPSKVLALYIMCSFWRDWHAQLPWTDCIIFHLCASLCFGGDCLTSLAESPCSLHGFQVLAVTWKGFNFTRAFSWCLLQGTAACSRCLCVLQGSATEILFCPGRPPPHNKKLQTYLEEADIWSPCPSAAPGPPGCPARSKRHGCRYAAAEPETGTPKTVPRRDWLLGLGGNGHMGRLEGAGGPGRTCWCPQAWHTQVPGGTWSALWGRKRRALFLPFHSSFVFCLLTCEEMIVFKFLRRVGVLWTPMECYKHLRAGSQHPPCLQGYFCFPQQGWKVFSLQEKHDLIPIR